MEEEEEEGGCIWISSGERRTDGLRKREGGEKEEEGECSYCKAEEKGCGWRSDVARKKEEGCRQQEQRGREGVWWGRKTM